MDNIAEKIQESTRKLKLKQIEALPYLALNESDIEIAKKVKVDPSTVWHWRQNKDIMEIVVSIAREHLKFEHVIIAINTLKLAMTGRQKSVEAAKTVLKMSGDLTDKLEFTDKTIIVAEAPPPTPEQQALCDKATKLNGDG